MSNKNEQVKISIRIPTNENNEQEKEGKVEEDKVDEEKIHEDEDEDEGMSPSEPPPENNELKRKSRWGPLLPAKDVTGANEKMSGKVERIPDNKQEKLDGFDGLGGGDSPIEPPPPSNKKSRWADASVSQMIESAISL